MADYMEKVDAVTEGDREAVRACLAGIAESLQCRYPELGFREAEISRAPCYIRI